MMVNDYHVDNHLEEILAFVHYGSIVNNRPYNSPMLSNHICSENTIDLYKSLRKHACSNILRILPPKNENFQMKNSGIFHISAQNIDCEYLLESPRRGGSNEYPQSMFLRRNKKTNVYPL